MILPTVLIFLGLALPFFMFPAAPPENMGGLGPGAWPRMALVLMVVFSALWLISEWRRARAGRPLTNPAATSDEPYSMPKALVGIVLIVAYGWALAYLGFAVTSALFIAVWCFYGGMRNPLVILPVALIGTGAMLWLFMGLALMPLSRGVGVFDSFSIWLLQTLQIY
jgi:putative tricarboxylic transport membrane protein